MTIDELRDYFLRLPPKGTKAADLTDRDKVALAHAAGVECEIVMDGTHMHMRTKAPVGFADLPDGRLIIGIAQANPHARRQRT